MATALILITSKTDIFNKEILNIHLAPFLLAGIIIAAVSDPVLFLSGLIIALIYGFFYYGTDYIANFTIKMGMIPPTLDQKIITGGDFKLAVVLALLLGHIPVLYGTAIGSISMTLFYGIKLSIQKRTPRAMIDLVMGRIHASAPFAPFLGITTIVASIWFTIGG